VTGHARAGDGRDAAGTGTPPSTAGDSRSRGEDFLAALCPAPPGWRVRWEDAVATLPTLERLRDCPQDPIHHAEGDVATHTRMVCESLAAMPAWRQLPAGERGQVFAAALLHDAAKPDCTRVEPDGRVTANGHAGRGERLARRLLWELGVPAAAREHVANLVRHHQRPFWAWTATDPVRVALTISVTARCDHLAMLARADLAGRVCADAGEVAERIDLFHALCEDLGCWDSPYRFPSDHARFAYFRTPGRDPAWAAFDDTRTQAILLSGLPASGKDHWIANHAPDWPVVSLDTLRRELRIGVGSPQGAVVEAARRAARQHLRRGEPFIWNATNLSRDVRVPLVELCHGYRARVWIVVVEAAPSALHRRNQARTRPVPAAAMDRMLHRWQAPDWTEAHQLTWIDSGASTF
jgi:predicted kinase